MKGYFHFADRWFSKKGKLPHYVVLFITERCTARCRHCLLGPDERSGADDELSIEEYRSISASMGDILFLLPTGGEPFLRDDLPEIVRIFHRNNRVRNTGIPTNGSDPDRVVNAVERILDTCPGMDLGIDVSIDGIGAEHDQIRNYPGLFEKAVETYRSLERFAGTRPGFNLNVAVTVSALNQDRLTDLYRYLKKELQVQCINPLLVRGRPRDQEALGVDPERYRAFAELLGKEIRQGSLSGYGRFQFSGLINAMKNIRQEVISRTMIESRRQIPCYAATLSCVIGSRGDVFACELEDHRLGNLRESGLDFKRLWRSPEAERIRRIIHTSGCYCTYECFLTDGIIFNPRMFPRLMAEWFRLRCRRRSSESPEEPMKGEPCTGTKGSPS